MTNRGEDGGRVLLVETDTALRELYERWLSERFDVRPVRNGVAAERLLEDEIDVLVLNRILPDRSERAVFELVADREAEAGVVILTTQPPDLAVLDVPFDEYLLKPVDRFTLHEAVERAQRLVAVERCLRRYLRLLTKRDLVESEPIAGTLSNSERYEKLLDRIAAVEACEECCFGDGSESISNGEIDS